MKKRRNNYTISVFAYEDKKLFKKTSWYFDTKEEAWGHFFKIARNTADDFSSIGYDDKSVFITTYDLHEGISYCTRIYKWDGFDNTIKFCIYDEANEITYHSIDAFYRQHPDLKKETVWDCESDDCSYIYINKKPYYLGWETDFTATEYKAPSNDDLPF